MNTKMDNAMYDVFISYSSKEFDTVVMIKKILETNGISCFMAPQDIPIGSSYAITIPQVIRECSVFLLALSKSSQLSQWVPKELDQALNYKKPVVPVQLEECELKEDFNFYLTNVRRYSLFEANSDSYRRLVSRIIKIRDGDLTGLNCDQEDNKVKLSPLLVEEKKDPGVFLWLGSHSPTDVEKELAMILTHIKKYYKNNPNAIAVKKWLNNQNVASFPVDEVLDAMYRLRISSYNAAEIDIQIALIYIHSGEKTYTGEAREKLNRAIDVLAASQEFNENKFKRIIYARWLLAVTYKQDRNYGIATQMCEELQDYVKNENAYFDLPYSDTLLLPQRELMVINKEKIICDYLVNQSNYIKVNAQEAFYTNRRIFEMHMINNEFIKAKELLPELLESYERCKYQLDAIYRVALYQNLFEYYTYVGERDSAEHYYQAAYADAKKYFWEGKTQKLETLKTILE